jgi:hypothetical protein
MSDGAVILNDNENRIKTILQELNQTDTPITTFYEQMEKEFGNRCQFSKFKLNIENFYPQQSKSKIIFLKI